MYKSFQQKTADVKRKWHLIDAKGEILGRTATRVAGLLMGKGKKTYSPQTDDGDYVVVVNAGSIKVTGRKEKDKTYYRHTGYPGGLRQTKLWEMRAKTPTRILELAVKNMLPKNRLQADRMARLKLFAGDEHPYGEKLKGAASK